MDSYKELLTCALCLNLYQDPVALNCLHTFCQKCISDLRKKEKTITCPLCRTLTEATSIKSDFRIKEFIGVFQSLKGDCTNPFQCCEVCADDIDPIEVHLCKDCGIVLCMHCHVNHEKGKRTKSHTIYALSSRPIPYCKEHNKKWEYFCNDPMCKKFLCVTCAIVFHEGHQKRTIKKQTEIFTEEISKNVEIVKTRIEEVKSHIRSSEQVKSDIGKKFRDMEILAGKQRDFVIKQANEAFQKQSKELTQKQSEILNKVKDNIEKLKKLEENMTSLLQYTKAILDKKSFCDVTEIKTEVKNVLENSCNINLKFVVVGNLDLKKLPEADIKKYVHSHIGIPVINFKEESRNILLNEKSPTHYEKNINPKLISSVLPFEKGFGDILYDKENDVIYSVRSLHDQAILIRSSKNRSTEMFFIENCSYGFHRNYLAMLPNNNLLAVCYSEKSTPARIIEVDSKFTQSKSFPIDFCKPSEVYGICSSPCRDFLLFVSESLLTVFKYNVKSKSCAKAKLPDKWKGERMPFFSISHSLDNMAFRFSNDIHIFSFKTQAVLRSFGKSDISYYAGIAFLTENVLIAGSEECHLNIFNVTNGKLLKKIQTFKDENYKECKINAATTLIAVADDSMLIFNQDRRILKLSL